MIRNPLLLLTIAALTLPALAQSAAPPAKSAHPGIDLSAIDKSVAPGDDFFRYADGAYVARTQIPADRAGLSVFSVMADRSSKQVASIIEDAAKSHPAPNSDSRKIADLYASYMDEGAIESRGLAPLKQQLADIAGIHSQQDLAYSLGETLRADVDALNNTNFHTPNLFGLWVAPGFNDPDHYAPYLMQGGLELPNRDFYLGDSDRMKSMRAAYQAHIAAMLRLAGFDEVEGRAAAIVALEHSIAERHISLADSEDIEHANNTWTMADFAAKAPGLDWQTYFKAAHLDKQPSFIVWQPSAIIAESTLVASVPVDIWKDFLAYHLIENSASVLPKSFAEERFNFFGKMLTGTTQQRPRDQRAVALVNGTLGDAVGQIYAQRYFPPEAKAQAQALVANLMTAFRIRLEALTWMAPATKKEALAKLDTLSIGIGYPDHWRSYAGLEIRVNDLFGNVRRAGLFELDYALSRIGKPVDRHEWCMEPQTVNAVNLPLDNGLNFPAAILQPPFFDPAAPAVTNYGHIGAIIGHEISHTFDSEGAAFDSHGRVRNWWTAEDLAHFNASTAALAAQYDKYAPFPDLHLNGRQTLGENIADLAGITAALDAFHIAAKSAPAATVADFTPDQQFFLAFGQNYEGKSRESALRQQVLTDPHSPGEFRADTVRNLDAWYAAFDVKPGQLLYLAPADRIRIW
jgi:endothelin-converting enzyme/putative endopeptidase